MNSFSPEHLLLILAGTALLLLGWMLYNAVLTFVGSILGGACGVGIGWLIKEQFDLVIPWSYVALGVGFVVGLAGGIMLFRFLNRAAFFWMGTLVGGWFVWACFDTAEPLTTDMNLSVPVAIALKVILSATIGVLCLWLRKTFVIIMTAMAGSLLIREGLGFLGTPASLGLLTFPVGLILQWKWSRKKRDRNDD